MVKPKRHQPKISDDKVRAMIKAYHQGAFLNEIAYKQGVAIVTVRKYLRIAGIYRGRSCSMGDFAGDCRAYAAAVAAGIIEEQS